MSTEDNKKLVLRFFNDLWNERRFSVADEILAADCVTHQLRSGAADVPALRSPEVMRAHLHEWLESFPDIRFAVEQIVADGDLVDVRCSAMGTHRAPWLGMPATGKTISILMTVTFRISSGRIAEDWVLVDFLGVLQQMGVVPATTELIARHHSEQS